MVRQLAAIALAALLVVGCARQPPESLAAQGDPPWSGPDATAVDLLRPEPGGARIFVQARLPDGEPGLFMIDTGAAISALSEDTAGRLGLEVENDWGVVEGLGGRTALHRAVLPTLQLGEITLPDVEFAVDVRGIPTRVGAMPLDGILGNNVWQHFTLEIDYPADRLVLHRPGTVRLPRRAEPMFFDGDHVFAPITITTDADPPHTDRVVIQVDTGASGLMLAGAAGKHFEQDYTEGIEPILGIGAHELLPPSQFLRTTRRVPVDHVEIGGRKVRSVDQARWMNFEASPVGLEGLKGLAGHDLLSGHVVFFDYQGGQLALRKSRGKKRQIDGHQVLLEQDLARYGDAPSRYLYRARLHAYMGHEERAVELLEAFVDDPPAELDDDGDLAEARVLLAAVRRADNDLEGAWQALAPLGPGELVDQGEIIAAVNGLLLEGRGDDALALARAATDDRPDEIGGWVALADALVAHERYREATEALVEAAHLAENPDANLLRRARIALAQGDRYGAMASIRELVQLYPFEGLFLWFYAELIDPADAPTFRHDLQRAMDRLHPGDRPLDFLVAAHVALGDQQQARRIMERGLERDCTRAPSEASKDNCHAWYMALAGIRLDEALSRVDAALAETGPRPDFLDTKAVVHLARGEHDQAADAATAAARLAPDDIYMLWQAERLRELARRDGADAPATGSDAAEPDSAEARVQ